MVENSEAWNWHLLVAAGYIQRSHTRMSVLELHGRLQGAQCYSYGSFERGVWPCGCASISRLFGVLPVVEAAS